MIKLLYISILFSFVLQDSSTYIYNFNKKQSISDWYVVNDGVMGGLSKGELILNKDGNAFFTGFVTTENNGGFSLINYRFDTKDVSNHTKVILKLKGDGKEYQFRIKENASQQYSYIKNFKTSGNWETITIPFNLFYPSYRGYNLDKPNYSGKSMNEIAILIGNKKKESFSLEIKSIAVE